MIETSLIIAFIAIFLHACTWEGMIFGKVEEITYKWPPWIKKPIFACPICMCPWWGSLILYISGAEFGIGWILTIFMAGGISATVVMLSSKDEIKIVEDDDKDA